MKKGYFKVFEVVICLTLLFYGFQVHATEEKNATKAESDKWSFIADDVADVNGIKISKEELLDYINTNSDPRTLNSLEGKSLKSFTREMIEKLTNQIILSQIAESEGFPHGYDLIKTVTEKMLKTLPENEKKDFEEYLASQNMTVDEFCEKKAANESESRQFAIEEWFNSKVQKNITVTDDEIKKYYDQAGDMVTASQILIKYDGNSDAAKAKAKEKAEKILKQIRDGADFRTLARTEGDCNSAVGGQPGCLGEFARGSMVQEFEDAAFALPVGGISDVVETPFGFHIIRVDSKRKRDLPPLNTIKDQIKDEISNIKAQDKVIEKMKEAKKQWVIKVTAFDNMKTKKAKSETTDK